MTKRQRIGGQKRLRSALVLLVLVVVSVVGIAFAEAGGMELMGAEGEYPDLSLAAPRTRTQLERLLSQTKANSSRFNTLSKATRLGYKFDLGQNVQIGWPALRHMRKHGTRFWGRVLDPKAPQALVWWCPSPGNCALVAIMYRAPSKVMPPMFDGLVMWHRHAPRSNWMTHLWLTSGLREALARCAPINALAQFRHLTFQPYHIDAEVDQPCSDTAPLTVPQPPPS
jgi:hypothetical protein